MDTSLRLLILASIFLCNLNIVQGQLTDRGIPYPDCDTVFAMEFEVEKLLASNNRFLFERQIDSIQSLYCHAKQIANLRLEALSLLKLAHEIPEELRDPSQLFQMMALIDECLAICERHKFHKISFWAKEKLCSMFTSNKMFGHAHVQIEDMKDIAYELNDSLKIAEVNMLLGRILREQKKFEESDSVLNLALRYETGTASSDRVIAFIYLHLSDLKRLENKHAESNEYAKTGMGYAKTADAQRPFLEVLFLSEIVQNNIALGEYNNADILSFIHETMKDETMKGPVFKSQVQFFRGTTLEKKGQFEDAITEYFEALESSEIAGTNLSTLQIAHKILSLLSSNNELSARAAHSYKASHKAYNSIIEQSGSDKLFRLTYSMIENERDQLERERQLTESERDKSRKIILASIFSIILFVIIVFLLFVNSEKNKLLAKQNKELAEKELSFRKLRNNLFANISHEFRTPLTVLKTSLSEMKGNDFKGSYKAYAHIMYRNVEHLATLADQMLDLAKMSERKIQLRPENIDPHTCIHLILSQLSSLSDSKNIKLVLSAPKQPVIIALDKDSLQKIIQNLVVNAIRHTRNNGKVEVLLNYTSTSFTFFVADTGEGIKENQLPYIFDRYFQNALDSDRPRTGGVGLALVKQLVELNEGTITVNSEWGKGSVFIVSLPCKISDFDEKQAPEYQSNVITIQENQSIEPDFTEKPLSTEKLISQVDPSTPLILIAEDDPDLNLLLYEQLSNKYRVIRSFNGKDALQRLQSDAPDLILTDIMMPEMSGIEFVENLTHDIRYSHIPVIVLSALEMETEDMKLWKDGIVDFITKPYDVELLQYKIANQLRSRQQFKEQLFKNHWGNTLSDAPINAIDQDFMKGLIDFLDQNLNTEIDIETLSLEMAVSRSGLYNKVKSLTGYSPTMFMRKYRLSRAKELLSLKAGNVSQISQMVGYSNPSQFSRIFKEEFGISPKNLLSDL